MRPSSVDRRHARGRSFRGEMVMYARPGHITSSGERVGDVVVRRNRSASNRSDELAALFEGDPGERSRITYCGGGIAASSTAFVMTRLGCDRYRGLHRIAPGMGRRSRQPHGDGHRGTLIVLAGGRFRVVAFVKPAGEEGGRTAEPRSSMARTSLRRRLSQRQRLVSRSPH